MHAYPLLEGGFKMKYTSPIYEIEAIETEDIMDTSDTSGKFKITETEEDNGDKKGSAGVNINDILGGN